MFTLQKILEMASTRLQSAIGPAESLPSPLPEVYREWLLKVGGGVLAFDGALRFFGVGESTLPSIAQWNARDGWKSKYDCLSPFFVVFAEDAFGVQFFFDEKDMVQRFTPETGEVDQIDMSIEEFVDALIDNPEETIGAAFFTRCVEVHGSLAPSEHFAFKVELALGGKYSVKNVQKMSSVPHMFALSQIARQISSMPEGTHMRPRLDE